MNTFPFPFVEFDFADVYTLFWNLTTSWYNVAGDFFAMLNQSVRVVIVEELANYDLGIINGLLESLINIIFPMDFTLIGFLFANFMLFAIPVMVIVVIARWVLDIGPL